MSAPLEALLRAALAGTGTEAIVWNVEADRITRSRGTGEPQTIDGARAHFLTTVDEGDRAAFETALDGSIATRQPLEHEYDAGGRAMRIRATWDGALLAGTITELDDGDRSAFERIVDTIPDFIARVDLDGKFLYLNRASENNAMGLARSELIGRSPQELGFTPATAAVLRDAELRVIATGEQQRVELAEVPAFAGRTLDVLLIPERDEQGRLVSILRVTRDVTAIKESEKRLQESEERLRLAARASLAMIYDWNMVTDVTYRSDAVRELTGFSPEETERSEWWISGMHPDDRRNAEECVREAIRRGEDRYENEYRVLHRDGSWRYVWDRGFIIRDETGRAVRSIGSTVDVTARRLAEEELKAAHRREREARADAERANRAKDAFLANLSHELRTPMTSILGWTSMLSSGMVEPQNAPLALRSIHDSARAQAQLIDDLLDISRIASGKLSIETGPVDLVSVLASVVESFRVGVAARSIELRVTVNMADLHIAGDEKRMRQIFTNLLANSLKFTPSGGRIDVELAQNDNQAIVTVRDTGIGIGAEFLPHVFERFSQQATVDTRTQGGLGLGLAIVRQIVELHGGSVEADSAGPGRGSSFTVRLPRVAVSFTAPGSTNATERTAPRLDGVRVLLVEDEQRSRDYLESVLLSSGAEVRATASVAEALGVGADPTVIVSDISMPGEDGLSLIAAMRTRDALRGCHTPAVAVTALGFGDDRRRILSAGFDEYLAKPVEPMMLLETVAALVRR